MKINSNDMTPHQSDSGFDRKRRLALKMIGGTAVPVSYTHLTLPTKA